MKATEAQKETLVAYTEYVRFIVNRYGVPMTFEEWSTNRETPTTPEGVTLHF